MSAVDRTIALEAGERARGRADERTRAHRQRGWIVRRVLLGADLVGFLAAFAAAELVVQGGVAPASTLAESFFFVLTLPLWIVLAKLVGLYKHDEERADHSTADELFGVFVVLTVSTWLFTRGLLLFQVGDPDLTALTVFWACGIAAVALGRVAARAFVRRRTTYLQNAIIIGAGDVGQLVARKLLKHPEYGINLLGFVDDLPKERREDLGELTVIGGCEDLPDVVRRLEVERAVVAFSNESHEEVIETIRTLRRLKVQIDVVPRLFEILGPGANVHSVESLPLLSLPSVNMNRSDRALKRVIDLLIAVPILVFAAPLFAFIALAIKRDSRGPVFFRQTRLGRGMREFTVLKFRTMRVDTDDQVHRDYIRATMDSTAHLGHNGLYKLDRGDAVTRVGRWLRKTSLDELPQLINVVRGDMSLVGPRPCIPYETEQFAPHHFERFLVPQGLTGLWQVSARAHASFGEALDMDVLYARSWSLGLDLRLLLRTPLQLLRSGGTA